MGEVLQRAVFFRELAPANGVAPEWIELLPAGPEIKGRDGRKYRLDNPQDLVDEFKAQGLKLPIDWEHGTQIKGERGERSPAAGWIDELEVRNGAVWGHVTWNEDGAEDIRRKSYRYLSPAFMHDKPGNIRRLVSAGLVHRPNLHLTALNRAEGNDSMTPELRKALGLSESATDQDAVQAAEKLRSDLQIAMHKAESPSLDKFVPRADHDLALQRAAHAEEALAATRRQTLEKEVDAELEAASKAGKITPATVAYHKAQCMVEGGLERFREFVKAAPTIAPASGLDGKSPEQVATNKALTADERDVCKRMGISEEEFVKARD